MNHAMVGDAAGFDAAFLAFGEHREQRRLVDFQGDVQIEVELALEFKRHVQGLEEGQARAIVHLDEGVQHVALGCARIVFNGERID